MKVVPALGFIALLMVPVLHAELLPFVRGERRTRLLARLGALATLCGTALFAGQYYAIEGNGGIVYGHLRLGLGTHELHFAVDALNAPLLVLVSVLTLAIVWGGPLASLGRRDLRALLWLEALLLLTLATADLGVLALSWVCQVLPVQMLLPQGEGKQRQLATHVTRVYHGVGAICVACACLALSYWTRPSGFLDLSLMRVDARAVPEQARPVLFALFALAALLRMGVAPFHSWLPVSFERGPLLPLALLVSTRAGLYLLARLAIPAFPGASHAAMPLLTVIALFSALYGALVALAQTDLRRLLAFWVVSQSGIMLTGLLFGDADSVSGTLLYWFSFALGTTGLALLIAALEARTGGSDMRQFGGLVAPLPMLSACFFLLGLATIAVPGTAAFVAEDMLVHGALETHPLLTLAMIVAMILNAISFLRAFTLTFLGQRHAGAASDGTLRDLLPRERVTAVSLLFVLVLAGMFPGVIVAAQHPAAKAIAYLEQLSEP